MPGRSRSALPTRKKDAVDELFAHEIAAYRRNVEKVHYVRRLHEDRAKAEKLLRDLLKKPSPQCEALMQKAYKLEDAGHLGAAADAYLRVLTCPDQADNHELRAYIGELMGRLNKQQMEAKAKAAEKEKQKEEALLAGLAAAGVKGPGGLPPRAAAQQQQQQRPATAGPAVRGRAGPPPPGTVEMWHAKPVGPPMPLNPEAYRAELAAQAMAVRRRRQEAARQAELADQKQLAVAAAMEALEQHRQRVTAANDRMAYGNELAREIAAREEDRRRRQLMEWDELKAAAEARHSGLGPLGGMDEYDRRRQAEWEAAEARQHQQQRRHQQQQQYQDQWDLRDAVQGAHAHRALARNAWEAPADPRALYHAAHGHDPRVMQEELAYRAGGGLSPHGGRQHERLYYSPPPGGPHQHGGPVAVGLRHDRPASAGTVARAQALAREREREHANALNYSRHYVPGHPYAAAGGPPPQGGVWPSGPAPTAAAAGGVGGGGGGSPPRRAPPGGGGPAAPFGRPGVDLPVAPINMEVVKARQQAFIDKRRKAEPPPRPPAVPLRVRKAAGHRPEQPQIAGGAHLGPWPPSP
ncbi:hypothetical protein HYH02_003801 [Chlamydomonas schloesseri]|uniref:Uncharacterized protein n=1 Tax=Chlamydomonas schloesseri TaxID=2026947 RepID=A0A836B9H1_9CHLO|nr:hypothetical protein HYH02_003801 [Chlamydomonas schloesseri]|eukprot:KAG2451194.1 hypothetical protein HYH02_003801 [Chlamydomonas schloesseri]